MRFERRVWSAAVMVMLAWAGVAHAQTPAVTSADINRLDVTASDVRAAK